MPLYNPASELWRRILHPPGSAYTLTLSAVSDLCLSKSCLELNLQLNSNNISNFIKCNNKSLSPSLKANPLNSLLYSNTFAKLGIFFTYFSESEKNLQKNNRSYSTEITFITRVSTYFFEHIHNPSNHHGIRDI